MAMALAFIEEGVSETVTRGTFPVTAGWFVKRRLA
jgi:hypothetical protein